MVDIDEAARTVMMHYAKGIKQWQLWVGIVVFVALFVALLLLLIGMKGSSLGSTVAYIALIVYFCGGILAIVIIAIRLSLKKWGIYKAFAKKAGLSYDHAQTGHATFSAQTRIGYDRYGLATRVVDKGIVTLQGTGNSILDFGRKDFMGKYAPFTGFPFGGGGYILSVLNGEFEGYAFRAYTFATYFRKAYFFFSVVAVDANNSRTLDTTHFSEDDDIRYENGYLFQVRQGMLDITDIDPTLRKLTTALA
ncbi:MAG: hypothetical protein LBG81_03020 [Coriobacteriaceae bacterium]|nr:hypothetical protein [Coriobacteriaceae bacterium]